jgi:hypothetical protein
MHPIQMIICSGRVDALRLESMPDPFPGIVRRNNQVVGDIGPMIWLCAKVEVLLSKKSCALPSVVVQIR